MHHLVYILLLLISIGLIFIGLLLDSQQIDKSLYSAFIVSVGVSMFIALTVARVFQHFSIRKIDEKFSYWNKKAAQASLSGIVGSEVPEELTDNLVKIIGSLELVRKNYEEVYSFKKLNDENICSLNISFTVINTTDRKITYPLRHEIQKGFFFDYGKSIKFKKLKVYDLSTNQSLIDTDKFKVRSTSNSLFHEREIKLKPNQEIRIVTNYSFMIHEYFSFFDSFFQPMHGVKIRLEHSFNNAKLGMSSAKFWKDRFVTEHSENKMIQLNYQGVVFPGQGIGIWIHVIDS